MTAPASITIWFSGLPVSVNRAWRVGRKNFFRSKKYNEYLAEVAERLRRIGSPVCPWAAIQVTIWFFPPDRRAYDADNRTKTLFDALTKAGFWSDDKIVTRVDCRRGDATRGGITVIRVEPPAVKDTDGLPESIAVKIEDIRKTHKINKRCRDGKNSKKRREIHKP